MSLAHSHKDLSTKDASTTVRYRATEVRPRFLSQPDDRTLDKTSDKVFFKPHGNAKPQEAPFMATRRKGFPTRTVNNDIHKKVWSSSSMPGKLENPTASNQFRRTWIADTALADKVGKWTGPKMKQHFEEQDKALAKLKPADEIFATNWNMKYWTHLEGEGTVAGGQQKLETQPARATGLHLKGGLYVGKFDNIKHAQLIVKTGWRTNQGEGKLQEWHTDSKRRPFDNRIKDDVIRYNDARDVQMAQANYEIYRPINTMSVPQLGAEHIIR